MRRAEEKSRSMAVTMTSDGPIFLHYSYTTKWQNTIVAFNPVDSSYKKIELPKTADFSLTWTNFAQIGKVLFLSGFESPLGLRKLEHLESSEPVLTKLPSL